MSKLKNLKQTNGKLSEEKAVKQTEKPASLKDIKEITGKVEDKEPFQYTTLEQVWGGANALAKYSTLNPEEYSLRLKEMNRADLEREARRVGVVVVEQTERLINNLKKEFSAFIASLKVPKSLKQNTKVSKEAQRILDEGR